MKQENEIRLKLLELYQAREEFSRIPKDSQSKKVQVVNANKLVEQVYHEKILMLEWVLNSASAKICPDVEQPTAELEPNNSGDAPSV
jgi:hypothetical protein